MKVISFSNLNHSLPIYITGIGLDYPQDEMRREEGFEDYQWLENAGGSGILYAGGESYPIEGQMAFCSRKDCRITTAPYRKIGSCIG